MNFLISALAEATSSNKRIMATLTQVGLSVDVSILDFIVVEVFGVAHPLRPNPLNHIVEYVRHPSGAGIFSSCVFIPLPWEIHNRGSVKDVFRGLSRNESGQHGSVAED
jgi:hypothetical protein